MGTFISTKHFHYDKNTREFTQEESSLPKNSVFGRREFDLVSHKTGKRINVRLVETLYDRSGEDVQGWRYAPTYRCSPINGVVIFND